MTSVLFCAFCLCDKGTLNFCRVLKHCVVKQIGVKIYFSLLARFLCTVFISILVIRYNRNV